MVLPEQIGNGFTELALSMGWHLRLRTDVAENEARLPHRVLLAFSPQAGECFSDRLVIRGPDQNYGCGGKRSATAASGATGILPAGGRML